jgi:cytochrome b
MMNDTNQPHDKVFLFVRAVLLVMCVCGPVPRERAREIFYNPSLRKVLHYARRIRRRRGF